MAIKLPDPGNGIPEQKTGNDEWTNMKIVRDNFADQSNAASRLVGTGKDQIPLTSQLFQAMYSHSASYTAAEGEDLNDAWGGHRAVVSSSGVANTPAFSDTGSTIWYVETKHMTGERLKQTAYNATGSYRGVMERSFTENKMWTEWLPQASNRWSYNTTSASAPNVVVGTDGALRRSSSSVKYKNILGKLELDDTNYQKALEVKPIVYRSKADADPSHWHYMSFSAEELGEYDPCLTHWRTHDIDPDTGKEIELEEKEAEGINLNAICAVLHATNIYQDKKLKELEQRLTALESNNEPAI